MTSITSADVYVLHAPEGFQWIQPANPEDYDLFRFDGSPRARSWTPVRMKLLTHSDSGRRERTTDFPFGANQLVLSQRAVEELGDVLSAHGEILPLTCDGSTWWIFNATRVIPALDTEQSDLLRAPDDETRILRIRKHVFRAHVVSESGAQIFRLAEMPHGNTYFRTSFVERIRKSSLMGLEFRPAS